MRAVGRAASEPVTTAGRTGRWISDNDVLVALLLLAAVVALLWVIAIPPWRAPDEPAHFGYLQLLTREHSLPQVNEAHLYPDMVESMNRTNFWGITGHERTDADPGVTQPNPAAGHPPFYYLLMLPAYGATSWSSMETQLYAVRVWSAVIFVLLIALSYRFARLVFPGKRYMQIGVPLLMIFHPQLTFISAGAMSDSLLVLLFTAFLYELAVFAKGDTRLLHPLLAGVCLGLGMLTKSSFMLAIPTGLAFMGVLVALRRGQRLLMLKAAAAIFGAGFLISGWYYIRNYIDLGSFIAKTEGERPVRYGDIGLYQLLFATRFRADLITSFVGNFSWLSIPLPQAVNYIFRRLAQLSVLGLTLSLVFSVWHRSWAVMKPWIVALFAGVFLLFAMAATYFELTVDAAQGRYLFPAIFPFWCLVLAGLTAFFPPAWRAKVVGIVVSSAAVLGVWSLFYEFIPRVS